MLLERLAQRVEDRRRELAQLVQEEDAGVCGCLLMSLE